MNVDDSLERVAVGAEMTLAVPPRLGLGHGPFFVVYDEPGTVAASGPQEGGVVVSNVRDQRFDVRCARAGVFSVGLDVTSGDRHLIDTVEVRCVTPTRFVATNVLDGTRPRYLAGASEVTVTFAWFGKADGHEVQLAGALPVTVAPGETAIEASSVLDTSGAYLARHRASEVAWASGGLVSKLPVEIVDADAWRLHLDFEETTSIWHGTRVTIARARAEDASGRPLTLSRCSVTTYHGDVASEPAKACRQRVLRDPELRRKFPASASTADRVCFRVLDHEVCDVVAE